MQHDTPHPDTIDGLKQLIAVDTTSRNSNLALIDWAEAGFFQQAGIPSIVCGPGSIEHAHKADEFVPLAQLAECEQFMRRLVGRLSSPAAATVAV